MAITITHANTADADAIATLLHTCWEATYSSTLSVETLNTIATEWHSPDLLRRQIADPRVAFIQAHTDTGTLVGIATAKRSRDEAVVTVLRLYVLPAYQRQGIGSQLLSSVLGAFPKAQRVELQVAEDNPLGRSFWVKQGFHSSGRAEARVGDAAIPLIEMERTVAA